MEGVWSRIPLRFDALFPRSLYNSFPIGSPGHRTVLAVVGSLLLMSCATVRSIGSYGEVALLS